MEEEKQLPQAIYDNAAETLKIAKITMMMQKDTAFYTSILFSLKQVFTEILPTAATDGKNLLVNPEFFYNLSVNERITLLAHEVLHVALDHMHRKGDRDPQLWNVAADYVINYSLKNTGYILPKGALYDSVYKDNSTVEVYDILNKKQESEKQNLTAGCNLDIQYPGDGTDSKSDVTEEEVTEIILRAQTQAKSMGQSPGSVPQEIGIELERTLNPPLPWYTILQNYMTEFNKDDYTFKRPNRRFLPDYYLPTARSEAVCNLAIFVDASSSVDQSDFNDFITKIAEIQKVMNPKKIEVVAFDTRIKSVQVVEEHENPFDKLKFNGRGGTRIHPVHEWINTNKPTLAIIFTDGEFNQTEPLNKNIPLIWLIYNNPHWESKHGGKVIHYEIK